MTRTLQPFAYAGDSPISQNDPTGMFCDESVGESPNNWCTGGGGGIRGIQPSRPRVPLRPEMSAMRRLQGAI